MLLTVEYLDKLRLPKKRRRYANIAPVSLSTIPQEWRELLVQWLRLGGNSRWDTLIKKAGIAQKTTAETLLDWLLNNGWASVDEERKHGAWWPYRVELHEQSALRQQLGLSDLDELTTRWQNLRVDLQTQAENNAQLFVALSALDAMPISRAIARAMLVQSLLAWQTDERVGTYRDFSLLARGATKEISKNEWDWLDTHFDLTEFNICQHTPLLLVSANLSFYTSMGEINLATIPDFAALTPVTIKKFQRSNNMIATWILVENRTSFERVARNKHANEGVIWIPGYPPSWWKDTVTHLIKIAPAPAKIACDPDPAGIAIALSVIALWNTLGQKSIAWKMGIDELENLKNKKTLSEFDQQQLAGLLNQNLPIELKVLAAHMQIHQQKGEQEGYL